MSTKRLLSSLLLLALLTPTFAACGEDSAPAEGTTAPAGETTPAVTTEEDTRIYADLEPRTFGGANFTIWHRANGWDAGEIATVETTGEVVNDAVFERNTNIETKLDLKIVAYPSATKATDGTDITVLRAMVTSGDTYDAMFAGATPAATLTLEGMLLNLYDVDYLDFEKPWWPESVEEVMSIDRKLFVHQPNISMTAGRATPLTQVNKEVMREFNYNMDDLYQAAADGKWTFDMMMQYSKGVAYDLNGDGTMDDNDRYGYLADKNGGGIPIRGAGVILVTKDENDHPVLLGNTEDAVNRLQYLAQSVMGAAETRVIKNDKNNSLFKNKQGLFNIHLVSSIQGCIEQGIDLGILPVPKYNEEDRYRATATAWTNSFFCLLKTTTDKNKSGYVIEALAAESQYTVVPAFYEVTLKSRYAQDPQSSDMLDLILASRTFDLSNIYAWGKLSGQIRDAVMSNSGTFVSIIESNRSVVETSIAELVASVQAYKE